MRHFDSGATRDSAEGKLDYEGFLSPLALTRFATYMQTHQVQADGQRRSADNWQKGIPLDAYLPSLIRHTVEAWTQWRVQGQQASPELEEALCAMWFNVQGALLECLRDQGQARCGARTGLACCRLPEAHAGQHCDTQAGVQWPL